MGFQDLFNPQKIPDSLHGKPSKNARTANINQKYPEYLAPEASTVISRGGEVDITQFLHLTPKDGFQIDEYIIQGYIHNSLAKTGRIREVDMLTSIGDHDLGGVTPPLGVVTCHEITPAMSWLMIGSDGLYAKSPTKHLAEVIQQKCKSNPTITGKELADALTLHAYASGTSDNSTVLVIPIAAMAKNQQVI